MTSHCMRNCHFRPPTHAHAFCKQKKMSDNKKKTVCNSKNWPIDVDGKHTEICTNLPRSTVPSAAELWLFPLPFEWLLRLLITPSEYFVSNAPSESMQSPEPRSPAVFTSSPSVCLFSPNEWRYEKKNTHNTQQADTLHENTWVLAEITAPHYFGRVLWLWLHFFRLFQFENLLLGSNNWHFSVQLRERRRTFNRTTTPFLLKLLAVDWSTTPFVFFFFTHNVDGEHVCMRSRTDRPTDWLLLLLDGNRGLRVVAGSLW